MIKRAQQKNIWLLCLAFMLTVIAPVRALALPALNADCSAPVIKECCKVKQSCCCSPAPKEPGKMESGLQSNQSAKFIPIKGTARPVISDWLTVSPALDQNPSHLLISDQTDGNSRPLYILKRSLLI